MSEKIIVANKGLVRAEFNFWVGLYMDKFYKALENRKIIGNKCSKCGDVFVPPRKVCGKCNSIIPLDDNWVNLPDTGTLINYTITPYRVNDRSHRKAKPHIIGMIRIDGSSTALIYRLLNLNPEEIEIGMKLKVEWQDQLKGDPSDIKGFVKF
ncbi:MAG: Zn-ribbon domain-containing OB-fold protein [Promethearchaeota archaeon]